MKICSRCGHPYTFYSGIDGVCLVCAKISMFEELCGPGPKITFTHIPDKLLDDVMKSPIVLEAERIISERSGNGSL